MRYERLILEVGSSAVTVRFHPRLTVIAGLARPQRDSLIGELLGALAGARRGINLEILTDAGRRLAILRPERGDERVLDLDTGDDVTREFVSGENRIDLLHRFGLDNETARRLGRMGVGDLFASTRGDAVIAQLAELDQNALWATAERVRATDARLKYEAELVGVAVEDVALIEEVEERHSAFEDAQKGHETARHNAIFTGGATAMGAVPAALLNRVAAIPFLAVSVATTLYSIGKRRGKDKAYKAMQDALSKAGAESYAGFQLQRMERLLEGQKNRQVLAQLAADHRAALRAWSDLAGEVTVDWALNQRASIMAASRRIDNRSDLASQSTAGTDDLTPNELAHTLTTRLKELSHIGNGGESLPLFLDEPLEGTDLSVKQWMLETVGRCAGTPQAIYLTSDPDVAAWARVEAIAGQLAVLEPTPDGA